MVKLAIYDKPASKTFPGLEQVIFVGNHDYSDGFHGTETNWDAQQLLNKYGQGLDIQQYACSSYGMTFAEFLDWAVDNQIDVINVSWHMLKTPEKDVALQKALDVGIIIASSAGNKGKGDEDEVTWPASDPRVIAVGAWDEKNNTIAGYSSWGMDVYVVTPGDLVIPTASENLHYDSGTSFASPDIAVYASIWKAITNGTREQFMEFLKENAQDVMTPGRDNATGWGLFTWSEKLNFLKEKNNMEIKMIIGSNKYYVDGIEKNMDIAPFIKDSRTFVPVRFIAEALGCTVEWDNNTRTVIITKE